MDETGQGAIANAFIQDFGCLTENRVGFPHSALVSRSGLASLCKKPGDSRLFFLIISPLPVLSGRKWDRCKIFILQRSLFVPQKARPGQLCGKAVGPKHIACEKIPDVIYC